MSTLETFGWIVGALFAFGSIGTFAVMAIFASSREADRQPPRKRRKP
jgi:hypothetical protein